MKHLRSDRASRLARIRPAGWLIRHNRRVRRRGEKGYVLVMTALCLIPLIIVSAFAIDFGGFYTDASKLQRVAEAASLAGVVWMPDLTTATTVATTAAANNGITAGSRYGITVSGVPGNVHQLKVTITDKQAPQYLSKMFNGGVSITRAATAEYEQPIPMGSPQNYFGTGNLNSGSLKENLWAAVNGYCSAKENGDLRLAGFDNAYSGGYDCATNNGAIDNSDYQPTGYLLDISIPAVAPASVPIQVYDAGFFNNQASSPDLALVNGATIDTTYQLLDQAGAPYDPLSHAVLSSVTVGTNNNSYLAQWKTVATINNPQPNTDYYLQVFTAAGQAKSAGSNSFAVRTTAPNGSFSACSRDPNISTPPYSAGCTRIFPYSEMSVFANIAGSTASFYLAEIDATYAGKTIDIGLFDPGEGANTIQVLDPNGNPVTFNWSTPCTNPPAPMSGGCSGNSVNTLTVSGNGTQPYPRTASSSRFNDRMVTLQVSLPSNYAGTYGTNTWWKIKYTTATSPTDRTTWTVGVEGSPVHLVN